MASSCPECGSRNVVEEDLYSQKQWVCEDCGSLVEEGVFTTTLSEEQHSIVLPYYQTTEVTKKPCPNLLKGLGRVRALCRILRLPGSMEAGAVSLLERAYVHPTFLHVRLVKKEVLGGCCVLCTCRQNSWPVSMGTVSNLLEADPALMGVVYQDLTKALGIEPPAASITDMLESYCYGYKLSPGDVPEVLAEPPRRMVERSAALVELAAETWLVTGRQPLPLLMACVYVAWQSLNPSARMKFTLNKFCQLSRLGDEVCAMRKEAAHKRVGELRAVLCKLGRELPWLRGGAVEPSTVARLADDILKHRQALLLKAMRHYEEECHRQAGGESGVETDPPNASHQSVLEESERKGRSQKPSPGIKAVPPAGQGHWGKRHLFLPPSVRPDKRPRVDAPEPAVTGDEEISDSEIEAYIRSPEEVQRFSSVQQKLKESKD